MLESSHTKPGRASLSPMRSGLFEAESRQGFSPTYTGPRRRKHDVNSLRTIIVVPCFNEAHRLDMRSFIDHTSRDRHVSYLMVDDGSLDSTAPLLRRMATLAPDRIRVLELGRNFGKAEAVRQGICLALRECPDVVGYWDADLATPLEAIEDLLRTLRLRPEVDIIIGSRVKLLGRDIDRRPMRHYVGRVFATLASITLRMSVYDTQCGAKLFRRTPTLDSYFETPFTSRWLFDVELLARATAHPVRRRALLEEGGLMEYPLHKWHDVAGSKLRMKDFVVAAVDLLRIWVRYRSWKRPPHS